MELRLQLEGRAFAIYAVVLDAQTTGQSCPFSDFISELEASEPASYKSMLALLNLHAEHGPVKNRQKSRLVNDANRIFEFKNRQGARLLYFYPDDIRRATVVTHGFKKGAPLKPEVERAIRIKRSYHDS